MPSVPLAAINLTAWAGWAPVAIGAVSALVIVTFGGLILGRRAFRRPVRHVSLEETVEPHHLYLQMSGEERRTSARRKGQHKPVQVTASGQPGGPCAGWVMDRSLGGLRLELEKAVPGGSILDVRLNDATGNEHAFRVEVVHCRPAGVRWQAGCRIVAVPPTEVLWLLG